MHTNHRRGIVKRKDNRKGKIAPSGKRALGRKLRASEKDALRKGETAIPSKREIWGEKL